MAFEFAILDWLQTIHTPVLDKIMTVITGLGNIGWFWIVLGLVLTVIKRTRIVGVSMLLALALGAVAGNLILKPLVHRARPCWINETVSLLIAVPKDYSFPSGHSLSSFAAGVSVFLRNKRFGAAAIVLASLIAVSRLYLYVHFPTDVLAGIIIGICVAAAAKYLTDRFLKDRLTGKTADGQNE